MPDVVKIERLKKNGWRKVVGCITCYYASTGAAVKGTFGNCQHPDAEYEHAKQGTKKLPCHAGATCDLWTETEVRDLDALNRLVNSA